MNRTRTIGANEAVSLQSVINNTNEYYIPLASSSMSYTTLIANRDKFQNQINDWLTQLSGSSNQEEILNITEIIRIQSERLAAYEQMIAAVSPTGEAPGTGSGGTGIESKTLLLLAAIAAAVFFYMRKKRRA